MDLRICGHSVYHYYRSNGLSTDSKKLNRSRWLPTQPIFFGLAETGRLEPAVWQQGNGRKYLGIGGVTSSRNGLATIARTKQPLCVKVLRSVCSMPTCFGR